MYRYYLTETVSDNIKGIKDTKDTKDTMPNSPKTKRIESETRESMKRNISKENFIKYQWAWTL